MERKFERELKELRERLLVMGGLAERLIRTAVAALMDRDERQAEAVLEHEHEEEMDRLCIEVDDRCFMLLALRQPMASDLRVLVAGIKINSDLERVGDQALSVALRARSLLRRPAPRAARRHPAHGAPGGGDGPPEPGGIPPGGCRAGARGDRGRRRGGWAAGPGGPPAPRGHDGRFRHHPGPLDLILVSRNLERIADHATNIAEDVIYIVRAEDVRERGEKEVRKGLRAPGP